MGAKRQELLAHACGSDPKTRRAKKTATRRRVAASIIKRTVA